MFVSLLYVFFSFLRNKAFQEFDVHGVLPMNVGAMIVEILELGSKKSTCLWRLILMVSSGWFDWREIQDIRT